MAWRTAPLPKDWKQRRRRVLERDGYKCRIANPDGSRCNREAHQVHHTGDPNDHREEVLVASCNWHHKKDTSARANKARKRLTQQYPQEKHPGLVE